MAKPFLKWAGGKGRLAPRIVAQAPPTFNRYIEPFLGAGAVFFALEQSLPGHPSLLADANPALIETFHVVRDDPGRLAAQLFALATGYLALEAGERREVFYATRAACPATALERAARFIFLNKTCYNGLFRVNSSGAFNVPHGRYPRPRIHDEPGLLAAAAALAAAEVRTDDFEAICAEALPGDFVYLDPPYQPLTATARFTTYTSADFGPADQLRLRDTFEHLTRRGVAAILSNSDHPAVRDLYGGHGYACHTVSMSRAINSKAAGRASIPELLIDNFERVAMCDTTPNTNSPSPAQSGEGAGG